jgi:hypothetical protein
VRNSQPKQREQQTSQEASDAEMMVKPGGRHRERSAGVVRRNDETSGANRSWSRSSPEEHAGGAATSRGQQGRTR